VIGCSTSAIRYHNGSIQQLARVEATDEYQVMMRRLAVTPRPPGGAVPPWVELRNGIDYYRRQWNKMMGRPATKDIGTLSTLISQLRAQTESQLGTPVESVVVATPYMSGLDWRDIREAINFAGLKSLHDDTDLLVQAPETSAAFAANGHGLCQDYTNPYVCEDEEDEMPPEMVLAVTYVPISPTSIFLYSNEANPLIISFTKRVLHLALVPMTLAMTNTEDRHVFEWSAGLEALPSHPSADAYWDHVRDTIKSFVQSTTEFRASRLFTTVLLLGESATDPDFLRVLRDTLREIQGSENPTAFDIDRVVDPLYAAARGAAEFAKRIQEAPPNNCIEDKGCVRQRPDRGGVPGGAGHGGQLGSDEL
jgi:hypothetical protein